MQKEGLVDFIGNPLTMVSLEKQEKEENRKKRDKIKYVTPTQLVQFLSEDLLDFVTPLIDEIFQSIDVMEKKELDIPSILQTKNGFEEISDLNGNVLPIMFYDHLLDRRSDVQENKTKKRVFQQLILSQINHFTPKEHSFLKEIVQNMPQTCESPSDYLYLANLHLAIEEKLYSKISQIEADEYNWLSDSVIQQCYDRLDTVLGSECNSTWTPEKVLIHSSANEDHIEIDHCLIEHLGDKYLFRFTARLDLWTENTIWEWKCTSKISVEHKIQLVIYAWLWHMVYSSSTSSSSLEGSSPSKIFRLFNLKTGELFELSANVEQLTTIVVAVIKSKYHTKNKKIEKDYIETANSFFSI